MSFQALLTTEQEVHEAKTFRQLRKIIKHTRVYKFNTTKLNETVVEKHALLILFPVRPGGESEAK